ncbi:MAG: hypothetical protein ACYDBI_05840 [Thermoplasmataceae archaeon]
MGASLIWDIVKKGGPYAAIAALGLYAYILHLKLVDCEAHLAMATLANHQYVAVTKSQDKSIEAAHAAELRLNLTLSAFQQAINQQTKADNARLRRFVARTPKGLDCQSGVIWTVKHSGGL